MATQAQIDSSIADLVKMGVLPQSAAGGMPMPTVVQPAGPPPPPAAAASGPDLPPAGPPRPPSAPAAGPPRMIAALPGAEPPSLDDQIGSLDLGVHAAGARAPAPIGGAGSASPIGPLDVGLLRRGGPAMIANPSGKLAAIAGSAEEPPLRPAAGAVVAPSGVPAAGDSVSAGSGAPAPVFVKAHFDDTRVPYRKETIAEIHKAEGDQITAIDAMAKARQDEATITANQLGGQAELAQQQIAERQAHEAARQARVEAAQSTLQSAIDAAAGDKVDPSQWWGSRSAFQQIMATAAVAIGGAWGGKGADVVNQQIAENINAQKANAELHQRGITNRANALQSLRDQFGDERQAEIALNMAQREAAMAKMNALVATTKSPQLRAQANATIAQLKETQLDRQREFDRLAYVQAHLAGGVLGGNVSQDRIVTLPDGRKVVARSDQEAREHRNRIGAVQNIQDNLDRALRLRKDASIADLANPYSTVRKHLEQLQAETAQLVTVARGQGAMSEGDKKVADTAIGAMSGVLRNNDEVLESTRKRWGEQLNREIAGMGAEHVETGYGIDKSGHVAPKAGFVGEQDRPRADMPAGFRPVR